jgi:hypothetical protein
VLSGTNTSSGAKRKERLEHLERQVTTLQEQGLGIGLNSCAQDSPSMVVRSDTVSSELGDKEINSPPDITTLQSFNDPAVARLKSLLKVENREDADVLLRFALKEKPDIGTIVLAGLQTLKLESDLASSSKGACEVGVTQPLLWPELVVKTAHYVQLIPDVLADGILLQHQPMLDVLHHNCQKIGLRLEDLKQHTCQSPWYSPFPSFPSTLVPLDTIPPDLYPTPAQRRFPHHPFIDLIPLPWLRERAITLDSLDPPPFDRFELKQDVFNSGMICWKSRAGTEGLPWDRKSWEVQPWFWTKWSWLIEEQGKVEQQTRWWRALREKQEKR